jgi:hypothetical protein
VVGQDLVVLERPASRSAGALTVGLEVDGATVEPLGNGGRRVLAGSGRKIAYSRRRATDATGRKRPARMEVAGAGRDSVLECGSPLPLWIGPAPAESGRGLPQSKTLRNSALQGSRKEFDEGVEPDTPGRVRACA